MKSRRIITKTVIVTAIAVLALVAGSCHKGSNSYAFETTVVKKGSIINNITATGTLEADTTVLIGTQVSGVINKIFVDFNSVVKKHQLLAVLDTTPLQTQVRQSQAALDQSKGEVEFQRATFERYQALLDKKLIAQADYDQVKYNYSTARANIKTAQAGYDKAVVNLNYAYITSPILGVVLNRAVDQGQTVASSFSTPNLFTVANDLTQMHVEAAVDEADIGLVRQGQPVDFTVDAFPTEIFKGSVRQIRLQPVVTSNVVTYTVIVNAPNPEKKLMPGMTANITVLVQKVDSILIVPGKALRFVPDANWLSEYMKKNPVGQRQGAGGAGQSAGNERPRTTGTPDPAVAAQYQAGSQGGKKPVVVWVKSGDLVHRTRVTTGAIDATNAEIKSGLKEGDEVILSMSLGGKPATATAVANPTTTSPFMPQRPPQGTRR
jgi:HlyD family secretion protein